MSAKTQSRRDPSSRSRQGADPQRDAGVVSPTAAEGFADPEMALPYKGEMERAFGTSFDDVQVHTGPNARKANRSMGSRAYTVGGRIALEDPNPSEDVVSHELTHVVQQTGKATGGGESVAGGSYEDEANIAAANVSSGRSVRVGSRAPEQVQMWASNNGISEHETIGDSAYADVLGGFSSRIDALTGGKATTDNAVRIGGKGVTFGEGSRKAGDVSKNMKDFKNDKKTGSTKGDGAGHTAFTARKEWNTQHKKAIDAAAAGHEAPDKAQRKKLYRDAMRHEAFASHFLQDCFASGHQNLKVLDWLGGDDKLEKLGSEKYHDAFNREGLRVESGEDEFLATGDRRLGDAGEDYKARIETAVKKSLKQVLGVFVGSISKSRAEKNMADVRSLIPEIDVDGYEAMDLTEETPTEEWKGAAMVEMMAADYQGDWDSLKSSAKPKTTASGETTYSEAEALNDGTMQDLFDDSFDGKEGASGMKDRIGRSLGFLSRALGGEADSAFARELVRSLKVRVKQYKGMRKKGPPDWLAPLETMLGKDRLPGQAEVDAMRAAVEG